MDNKRIEWMTPKGTPVALTLRTAKEINLDGDKSMVPDWTLQITYGPRYGTAPKIETHPEAGQVLRDGNALVPIAAEVLDAVTALVAEYKTEADRRMAEWIKGEREYDAHCKRMAGPGMPNDPNAL